MKVRFCQDIARGMEYLHTNDIIHHDLKTDNVLVYSKNPYDSVVCKVSDFGTSQAFIESSNTLAIQDVGTPIYMAPEVHKTGKLTLKSDVFSYAICMLELWLTHDPYPIIEFHDGDSILAFVCSGKRVGIPRDCIYREIIKQSWHQNPVKRPKFTEIVDHINQIVIDLLEYKKTPTCGDTTTRTMTLRNSFSRGINKRRTGSMGKKEHSPIKHFKKIKLNNSKIDKKLTQNSYINEPLNDKDTIPLPLNTDFSLIDVDICHQYISPHRLSVTKSSLFKQIPYTPRQSSQNGTNISRNARHSQPSPTQILTSVHTFSKSNQKNIL
ncbi:Protein tyrosine kinase domain containing protein [Entamoeba marina]